MERRKFVVGLGALASGSAAAMGTGAFTSVQADRNTDINVAGDASAFLGVEPVPDSANADTYVIDDSIEGTEKIALNGDSDNGNSDTSPTGVNANSVSDFEDLLRITNQGSQEVEVTAQSTGMTLDEDIIVDVYADTGSETVSLNDPQNPENPASDGVTLSIGGSFDLGIEVDLQSNYVGSDVGKIFNVRGINADATDE